MKIKIKTNQKGAALFLAIMLLGFIFTVGIVIMNIQIKELRLGIREGASAKAIFAADAGIERALYQLQVIKDGALPDTCMPNDGDPLCDYYIEEENLDNGSSYYVIVPYGADNPVKVGTSTEYIVLRSIGNFHKIERSLEVSLYKKLPAP